MGVLVVEGEHVAGLGEVLGELGQLAGEIQAREIEDGLAELALGQPADGAGEEHPVVTGGRRRHRRDIAPAGRIDRSAGRAGTGRIAGGLAPGTACHLPLASQRRRKRRYTRREQLTRALHPPRCARMEPPSCRASSGPHRRQRPTRLPQSASVGNHAPKAPSRRRRPLTPGTDRNILTGNPRPIQDERTCSGPFGDAARRFADLPLQPLTPHTLSRVAPLDNGARAERRDGHSWPRAVRFRQILSAPGRGA